MSIDFDLCSNFNSLSHRVDGCFRGSFFDGRVYLIDTRNALQFILFLSFRLCVFTFDCQRTQCFDCDFSFLIETHLRCLLNRINKRIESSKNGALLPRCDIDKIDTVFCSMHTSRDLNLLFSRSTLKFILIFLFFFFRLFLFCCLNSEIQRSN